MGEWGLAGAPVSFRRSLRSGASRRPGSVSRSVGGFFGRASILGANARRFRGSLLKYCSARCGMTVLEIA